MNFETIKMALGALVGNKFRTLLSMLGIIIGVSTVIAVVGIGMGAQRQIEEQFKNLSVTSLMVMPNRGSTRLSIEDVDYVLENAQFVVSGNGSVSGTASVANGGDSESVSLIGITTNFFDVSNLEIGFGSDMPIEDYLSRNKKVILGYTIAETLFEDPALAVGEVVTLSKRKYDVVGVLKENGSSSFGTSYDDTVYVPYDTAAKNILGRSARMRLVFLGKNVDVLPFAEAEITELLRTNHKLKDGKEDDFRVRDPGSMVASAKESTSTMSFLLTAVATIVLIVSGIGIMNVMFVTVAERTKEIGVLKAIGAKQQDILMQFLAESVILSIVGGMIGILLGQAVIPFLENYGAVYSLSAVLLGFGFSVVVGIFFGFYPALKASRLDPVDALRSE